MIEISRSLGRPATVREFSQQLFHQRSWGAMADSETYAHLEHLRLLGRAERHEGRGLARVADDRAERVIGLAAQVGGDVVDAVSAQGLGDRQRAGARRAEIVLAERQGAVAQPDDEVGDRVGEITVGEPEHPVRREQHGLTIGIFNDARELNGVQIGLLNRARNNAGWKEWLPIVNASW